MWPLFLNDTTTPQIYTLSLHDALPISLGAFRRREVRHRGKQQRCCDDWRDRREDGGVRSEEHTSELQSHSDLVCRLLLEKKKKKKKYGRVSRQTRKNSN